MSKTSDAPHRQRPDLGIEKLTVCLSRGAANLTHLLRAVSHLPSYLTQVGRHLTHFLSARTSVLRYLAPGPPNRALVR